MKYKLTFFFLSLVYVLSGQTEDITNDLYDTYDNFKETTLNRRRIKRNDIEPLIVK